MISSVWLVRLEYLEKSLHYALEHWTGNLRSKFGPIPTKQTECYRFAQFLSKGVWYRAWNALDIYREAQQCHYDAIVACGGW